MERKLEEAWMVEMEKRIIIHLTLAQMELDGSKFMQMP